MREHRYSVYIAANFAGTLYVGVTGELFERIMAHKQGEGSKFAKRYGCTRLLYYETYQDVHRSLSRETQIKSWSRTKKIALIESVNPEWKDLASDWGKPLVIGAARDSSTPPRQSLGSARNDNSKA